MRKEFADCHVEWVDNRLVVGNNRIRRSFEWNGGDLISRELSGAGVWKLRSDQPDCHFPGEADTVSGGRVEATVQAETPLVQAHLVVEVFHCRGELEIRRRFRIYPETPAIAIDYYLRGVAAGDWSASGVGAGQLSQLENAAAAAEGNRPRVLTDRLHLDARHLYCRAVRFFDITDRRNNLVQESDVIPYRQPQDGHGQLLLIRDPLSERHLFVLKEAPCSDIQLANPGCDFISQGSEFRMVGLGLYAGQVKPGCWTRAYGVVIGVADSETGLLRALRQYQHRLRRWLPGRDHMIMQNTWGDRGQDRHLGEEFAVAELRAGARLGSTHFQLDDGWQSGRSSNSAFGGTLNGIWDREDYWSVHPEKFPNGLEPVLREARKCRIELCLWFNPSKDDSYANWEKDADCLIGFYRQHGIRTFKIDGVDIPDKRADENLRAMFDKVMEATGGDAVFNLDVTAGRRCGYHYFYEYGNKFLENRYTDWCNYYPHWTLRNLWQLSRYVPPQTLQIEFLNGWRNADRYPADDPLAPRNVPFAYCFGVTVMAQPLAWFEASHLPEEAFAIAPLVKAYRKHQMAIHAGHILPIGGEPSGIGWTGFQSIQDREGFFAVYRERNADDRQSLAVIGLEGKRLRIRRVLGDGRCRGRTVSSSGELTFEMPTPFSFGVFHYTIVP